MTTPPEERDRPLINAIHSLKLLGAASAVWGFVFVFAWGYFNKMERFRPHFIVLGLVCWGIPGVLFYLCGYLMQREARRRAATWGMALTLFQCLFAGAALVASLIMPPVSPIPILLCVLWVAALVQLFVHLKASLPLLSIDTDHQHGFDITSVHPVLAAKVVEASTSIPANIANPSAGTPPTSERSA